MRVEHQWLFLSLLLPFIVVVTLDKCSSSSSSDGLALQVHRLQEVQDFLLLERRVVTKMLQLFVDDLKAPLYPPIYLTVGDNSSILK